MPTTGITLTVNAETAAAAARMEQFFSGVVGGIDKLLGASGFLAEMGGAIAAAFTVGAIVDFTKEAIKLEEQIGKLAQKTGLQIELLAALKKQAAELGVPFDQLNLSLGLFADKIGLAVRMGGTVGKVFHDINVPLVAANGTMRSTGSILSDVADRFQKAIPVWEKAYIAQELFGRSGRELIPILNEGAAGIDRMRLEGSPITEEAVKQATEFSRAIRDLTEKFDEVFLRLANNLLPAMKDFVRYLQDGALAIESGRFEEFFELSLKAGIIGASNLMMEQIEKWGKAWTGWLAKEPEKKNGVGPRLGGQIDHAALAGFWNIAGLIPEIGAQLGIPYARQVSDQYFDWGYQYQQRAGIGGGPIDKIAEHLSKSSELSNPFKDELEKLRVEMKEGAERMTAFKQAFAASMAIVKQVTGFFMGSAGAGAGTKAPISVEAEKLLLEVDKAHAEATKGKLATLEVEKAAEKKKITDELGARAEANAALLKIDELFAAKEKDIRDKAQEERIAIDLARAESQRQLIEKNPDLTELEKKKPLLAALGEEKQLREQLLTLYTRRANDSGLTPEAQLQARGQASGVSNQLATNAQTAATLGGSGTFGGEMSRSWVELQNQFGETAKTMAAEFKNVFSSAVSSISSGISSLIMGTKKWGDALKEIGTSILTSVINAIVKMGVQYVLTHGVMQAALVGFHAIGKALKLEDASTSVAANVSQIPSATTLAAVNSVGSYGAAAAEGAAALVAAMGVMMAAMGGGAGFEEGGYTGPGGRGQVVGVVHPREFVFSAPAVDRIGVHNLQAMHSGAVAGPIGQTTQRSANVNLAFFNDESQVPHWAKSQDGESHIVDVVRRNLHRIQ